MNLGKKLVILCLLFGAVPMAAVTALDRAAMQQVVSDHGQTYEVAARDVGDMIDRNLFERYGDVQAFAVNEAVKRRTEWYRTNEADNAITRVMNSYVSLYGIYTLTLFVDTAGRLVAVNSRDAAGQPLDTSGLYAHNFRETRWFQDAAAGRFTTHHRFSAEANTKLSGTVMEDIAPDELTSMVFGKSIPTIGFTAPVHDGDEIIGYWTNRASFAFVEDLLRDAQRGMRQPVDVELYSADGRLLAVAGPDGQASNGKAAGADLAASGHRVAVATSQGRSGSMLWDGEGGQRVYGYSVTDGALGYPGLGWGVAMHLDVETAAAHVIAAQRRSLIVGLTLLVLVGIAALYLARRLSRPIVTMADVAERLARGDVDQVVSHQSDDELGRLADSFRSTIDYIKSASQAVAQLGAGETQLAVVPRSEHDELSRGMQRAGDQITYLVSQVITVAGAAEQGQLSTRVEIGTLEGDYAALASTINTMLDAMNAPVEATTHALERVAGCDLTASVAGDFSGDHARLKVALNTAVDSVRTALFQVSRGSEQVRSASGQIASGSQSLAAGASQQAASLAQSRSVLERVAVTTTRNAESAEHANTLSIAARESSTRGVESLEQMTQAVGKIRRAVENTAQIIRDINQIAFQTNLLALNAAVEAARAGDAGRGFAVVADEVRNLAQQAKHAAHKTEELLQDSIRQAERGEAITVDVTHNLSEIVGSVKKVGDIISEIAAVSREQAAGIALAHKAAEEMDGVTNHNAASSEELSSTAEELAAQAQELASMVGNFRLGRGADAPARATRTNAPNPTLGRAVPGPEPRHSTVTLGLARERPTAATV